MNICVYGGSSGIIDPIFITEGEKLGREMARRGHGLVFGAGASGLMGALARGMYECGGHIVGVAPSFFDVDGALFEHCDELIRPDTMRQRKQIMEDRSDAFIMTPGGIGTFDEFFEMLTLKQLGRHKKAICILNTRNYYKGLFDLIDVASKNRFMTEQNKHLYRVFTDTEKLLDYIESYHDKEQNPGHYKFY